MTDALSVFGREIPLYGLCFFVGIGLAALVAVPLAKKRKIEFFDFLASAGYALIFAILGAKLLFIAVSFRQIIELELSFYAVLKGGFVFYGGLLGGAFGVWFYTKLYHVDKGLFDVFAAVLPLGHAFGRVGCFFAGCCYGIPYDGFPSVTYHETIGMTPTDEPLLAIQLIEAAGLLVLFGFQLLAFFFSKKDGDLALIYCLTYPVMRFCLEFFRGDAERGLFLRLSTSQWTSLLIFAFALICLVRRESKQKAYI